ncbi:MAG: hypothetical protein WKF67_00210, partial [Rubrobacteraceae bacterium]
ATTWHPSDQLLALTDSHFAPIDVTLIVAMTMQHYRLDLMPGQTVKTQPKGTLRPRPGVWMAPHRATGTAAI